MPRVDVVIGLDSYLAIEVPDACTVKRWKQIYAHDSMNSTVGLYVKGHRHGRALHDNAELPLSPRRVFVEGPPDMVRELADKLATKSQQQTPEEVNVKRRPRRRSGSRRKDQLRVLPTQRNDLEPVMQAVLTFWFKELTIEDWFTRSDEVDDRVRRDFAALHFRARAGELTEWPSHADSCLVLVVVLDQFTRILYRDNFAVVDSCDSLARDAATKALARSDDRRHWHDRPRRLALYLPFMHSEDASDRRRFVSLVRERLALPPGGNGTGRTISKPQSGEALHRRSSRPATAKDKEVANAPNVTIRADSNVAPVATAKQPSGSDSMASPAYSVGDSSATSDGNAGSTKLPSASAPPTAKRADTSYSIQSARKAVWKLPALKLEHKHAQAFRDMAMDYQSWNVYKGSQSSKCVPYKCMVCTSHHRLSVQMSKSESGSD